MAEVFVNILIPRWIVEERPDATNVNNWHWTEKNADAWSKAKIKVKEPQSVQLKHVCPSPQELFENHVIEVPSVGNVILEEVEKIEGEARANNRKGKLIFFYEWEIAVKWKGHANGKDTEVHKTIMPNLLTDICHANFCQPIFAPWQTNICWTAFISGDG